MTKLKNQDFKKRKKADEKLNNENATWKQPKKSWEKYKSY
jgi:hypothetical protein